MTSPLATAACPPFEIFRGRDATDCDESVMYRGPASEVAAAGAAAMVAAGLNEGSRVKVVYKRPGMSLTYCWFKSGYPLPLHSHNTECLYFIVSGSVRMGTETLNAGDGFFTGVDVPYSYTAGEDVVELLEFRNSDRFDGRPLANAEAYWQRALADLVAARKGWSGQEAPPSGMQVGQ
jgi:hypothetical protein